jgi:hypothetical protein
MEDKTFAQAIEELNQRAFKDITDEALRCWTTIQQGATVDSATAHIENEHMRESVRHVLFYVLLQSLLFEAKHRQLVSATRHEELKAYIDTLTNQVKQQPFMVLPISSSTL